MVIFRNLEPVDIACLFLFPISISRLQWHGGVVHLLKTTVSSTTLSNPYFLLLFYFGLFCCYVAVLFWVA